MINYSTMRARAAAAAMVLFTWSGACQGIEVLGHPIDDSTVVEGVPLRLNGAGYRKRAYSNTDISAIYTRSRMTSIASIENSHEPWRLRLIILQDTPGSVASRYFMSDFEAAATHDEFIRLINEVALIGGIYASLPVIRKGDVVTLDSVPGRGMRAWINDTPLTQPDNASRWLGSDLMARVFLRMFVAGRTPRELQRNLLGLSHSMSTPGSEAAASAPALAPHR